MWKHPAWWASPGSLCDFRLIFSPFSFREMSCFQLGFATCTHHLDDDGISHASGWMYANLCLSNIIVIVANINSHNGLCLKLNHIYTKSLWPALFCWCALNTEHWTPNTEEQQWAKWDFVFGSKCAMTNHTISTRGACFILLAEAANYGQNLLLIYCVAFHRRGHAWIM